MIKIIFIIISSVYTTSIDLKKWRIHFCNKTYKKSIKNLIFCFSLLLLSQECKDLENKSIKEFQETHWKVILAVQQSHITSMEKQTYRMYKTSMSSPQKLMKEQTIQLISWVRASCLTHKTSILPYRYFPLISCGLGMFKCIKLHFCCSAFSDTVYEAR